MRRLSRFLMGVLRLIMFIMFGQYRCEDGLCCKRVYGAMWIPRGMCKGGCRREIVIFGKGGVPKGGVFLP